MSMPGEASDARSEPASGDAPPTPIWISHRLWVGLIVAAVALLLLAIWRAPSILTVVLGGVTLALILSIPVRWLSRVMPRWLAIVVVFLLLLGVIALALAVIVPLLIDQLTGLVSAWPRLQASLDRMLDDVVQELRSHRLVTGTGTSLADQVRDRVSGWARGAAMELLRRLLGLASGAIGSSFQAIAVVIIAVYLLLDARKLREWFIGLPPARYHDDAAALWDDFGDSIGRYLGGVILVAVIAGGLAGGALLALGVPYPALLGLWNAFTAFIPIFGTYLGVVPVIPLALTQSPRTAVLAVLAYVIIQQLQDNVLTPRVQSRTAHTHPIVVLVTVLWTALAFGLFWSALAVPALVAFRVLFDFFRVRLRVRPDRARASPARAPIPGVGAAWATKQRAAAPAGIARRPPPHGP